MPRRVRDRATLHVGEGIVLRLWPFQEADLLISLFTRDQGKVRGVARHALRSRRRFGGALEPMTLVRANYAERPKQELVRLDAFEIVWSPLRDPLDWQRTAGLQLLAEILEEALPELAVDDPVFRLTTTVLPEMQVGRVSLPATYFCLWLTRLMGWMPELGRCSACGLDLHGQAVWWSPTADGVVCYDDRGAASIALEPASVQGVQRIFRSGLGELMEQEEIPLRIDSLLHFGVGLLERHLQRRLRSAAALLGRAR